MNFAQRIGDAAFLEHGSHVIGSTGYSGVVDEVDAGAVDGELSTEADVSAVAELDAVESAVELEVASLFDEPHAARTRMAPINPIRRDRVNERWRMSS